MAGALLELETRAIMEVVGLRNVELSERRWDTLSAPRAHRTRRSSWYRAGVPRGEPANV